MTTKSGNDEIIRIQATYTYIHIFIENLFKLHKQFDFDMFARTKGKYMKVLRTRTKKYIIATTAENKRKQNKKK